MDEIYAALNQAYLKVKQNLGEGPEAESIRRAMEERKRVLEEKISA
jgi:hypothetical protein